MVIEHLVPMKGILRWLIEEERVTDGIVEKPSTGLECAVVTKDESARLPNVGTRQERYAQIGLAMTPGARLTTRKAAQPDVLLRSVDGREADLEGYESALRDIVGLTGARSGRGQWSRLLGLRPEPALANEEADRLGVEAASCIEQLGASLSEGTIDLLTRLAGLRPS